MTHAGARPWLRPLAMRLHRWVALGLGTWFALLGLTGAFLVRSIRSGSHRSSAAMR
jgi:hypothetical protein